MFFKILNFFFLLGFFNDKGRAENTSNVVIIQSHTLTTVGKCNKPREDVLYFHSCDIIYPYPRSQTYCFCTNNYPQIINFVCNNNTWYRVHNEEPCSESPLHTALVTLDIRPFNVTGTEKCNRPLENVAHFHSCTNIPYPQQRTSCYCTANYPQKINLICANDYRWHISDNTYPCRVPDTARVYLKQYNNVQNLKGACLKPEESLTLFHSCNSTSYEASCFCTANYPIKVNLICVGYSKNTWLRSSSSWYIIHKENPCKEYYNPKKILCYKDIEQQNVVCKCRRNCASIESRENITIMDVVNTCDRDWGYFIHFQDKNLISYMDGNYVKYNCLGNFELIGPNSLYCNNGLLNGQVPKCSPLNITINNSTEKFNTDTTRSSDTDERYNIYEYITFGLAFLLTIIIIVIISYFVIAKIVRNRKKNKNSMNNKDKNKYIDEQNANSSGYDDVGTVQYSLQQGQQEYENVIYPDYEYIDLPQLRQK